jgi:O-antigen/teichoic acid export membrane protein
VTLGRNLLAGMASAGWSALVSLAAIPFYLKFLGIEAYGLIGFFATTQALLQFLDMGMSPTINREVARCAASGKIQQSGHLLHTLAVVYWSMALMIGLSILVLAPFIAEYWLTSKEFSVTTLSFVVMLMGLVVACRWPVGLYQGALIGAQRLTVASGINMVMVSVGAIGAVSILAFVSPTIEAFFIWQGIVGLVYALVMRSAAWRIVGKLSHLKFSVTKLKEVWRFTAGMTGVALTALAFTQLDKVLLSNLLGLEYFGYYMLAAVVVSALSILVSPVYNVVFPRFSMLVAKGDNDQIVELYRLGTRMLATVIFPVAMVLVFFSRDIVLIWTGNPDVASEVGPLVSLLVMGTALNGVMYFPYALQLAYGKTWIPLLINLILMCFLVPIMYYLVGIYGALGGALAWLVVEVCYVLLGSWLTHRHMLEGIALRWLCRDVGTPLILSSIVFAAGSYFIQGENFSIYARMGWALGLTVAAFSVALMTSGKVRNLVLDCVK